MTEPTDDLDTALRSWGAEQRQHAACDVAPAIADLLADRRRSHAWVAVAASVVLVAALALGLGLGLHRSPTVAPAPSAAAGPANSAAPRAAPLAAATRVQVAALARRLAIRSGDASATARGVLTTPAAIRPLFAEPARDSTDYWVIELHGHLMCRECLGPPDPTVDYTLIIVRADLRHILVSAKIHYDLSKLGRVVTLIP